MIRNSIYAGATNGTNVSIYSPVTLNQEWPAIVRLVLVSVCSFIGTIVNSFFISSFFIEPPLMRTEWVGFAIAAESAAGNSFLVCMGFTEMTITAGVMSISAVVILSGEWDVLPVCHIVQFITEAATYSYSLFFLLIALDSYYKYCCVARIYNIFISKKIWYIISFVYGLSFLMAGVGMYLGFDYDYCERHHYGNFYFRASSTVIFHAIPMILIVYYLLDSLVHIRQNAQGRALYRRSQQYSIDLSMTYLNMFTYLSYVAAWTPFLLIVNEYPNASDKNFYYSAWIGVGRSIISCLFYGFFNANFRRAYSHLFYYCFCKIALSKHYNRPRRGRKNRCQRGEVRVRMAQEAVIISSPQHAMSSVLETNL